MPLMGPAGPVRRRQAHNTVSTGLLSRHRLHRHETVAGGFETPHHLLGATGAVAVDEVVGKQDRERLVADRRTRAQHRVTQPERRRLANVHARHATRQNRTHARQQLGLALRFQRRLEIRRTIEVILDRLLRVSGDEHEMIDTGRYRFFRRVLDEGLVDDREHLLRERLRRRQEPGAQPRHGEDRLSNSIRHCLTPSVEFRRFAAGGSRGRVVPHAVRISFEAPEMRAPPVVTRGHLWHDPTHPRPTQVYSNPSERIGPGS